MAKYRIPNENNNEWIAKCNEIIEKNENNVQLSKNNPNYVTLCLA